MLETVLAAVLMAMIATTLVAGLGFVHADHRRQQRQLGAAEIANRLMLQYLDEKSGMPSDALAVTYGSRGQYRYYWRVREDKVSMREVRPGSTATANRTGGVTPDRIKLITVRVWNEQTPNVNPALSGVAEDFRLARLTDPIAPRNPDSLSKILRTPEGMAEWLRQFQGNE
ncbi:MAG: hypothetical protein DYG94_01570 [Leptolyngbya sp. PLA3]|nr:MAG: hypothetical protein EDM82_00315 [Cyanobacteria bacterium CYA]MCE7967420.1 hypothetical protein [Leptolyngbya sp. PL-A3]